MSKFLDYPGLEHYNDKVQGQISQLGLKINGYTEQFEVGGINYLYGWDIDDPTSIRSGQIPIEKDTTINLKLAKAAAEYYVITYLNGNYVGYRKASAVSSALTINITADSSYNSIRLRVGASTTWTESEAQNSYYQVLSDEAVIAQFADVRSDIGLIDNEINGLSAGLEQGSINYESGANMADPRCLRTVNYLSINSGLSIALKSLKRIYGVYIIKYAAESYAGYNWVALNAQEATIGIDADGTFDSIRLRLQAESDWSTAEFESTMCEIRLYGPLQNIGDLFPARANSAIPSQCLTTLIPPKIELTEPSVAIEVSSASELADALQIDGSRNIIIKSDIITSSISEVKGEKHIYGFNHKIIGYKYAFQGASAVASSTHNAYAHNSVHLMTNSNNPLPFFADQDFNIHQWKESRWYDAPGRVTNADGTTASVAFGSFRVPVPSDFTLSADEVKGTYIHFFTWFHSQVAKVDKLEDGYIYFTTSLEVTDFVMDPDADYTATTTRFTSFRLFNFKSPGAIYFDDTYIYVPKEYGSIYLIDSAFVATESAKIVCNRLNMYASIDCSATLPLLVFENCEFCYLNNPINNGGGGNYVYFKDCIIHDVVKDAILASGNWCVVENSSFMNCGINRQNVAAIHVTQGKYVIKGNDFKDFGYMAMFLGSNTNSANVPAGIVEDNHISQTLRYFQEAEYHVPLDSGAIYIATWNDKDSVGAVIRNNIIRNYNGRGANFGIFGDDGASYVYMYANQISNVKNSSCIDFRYASGRPVPDGYQDNNAVYIIGNVVDGRIHCAVGTNSTVAESVVRDNVRLYSDNWDVADTLSILTENALASFSSTIKDKTGYFDADGVAHSALL